MVLQSPYLPNRLSRVQRSFYRISGKEYLFSELIRMPKTMYCIYQPGTVTIFSANNIPVSEKGLKCVSNPIVSPLISFKEEGKKAKLSLKFWFELTATLSLSDLFVQSYYCKHSLWMIQSSPTPETQSYKVVNAISTIILHLSRASHPKYSSSWQGDPFPGWAPNVDDTFSIAKGKRGQEEDLTLMK